MEKIGEYHSQKSHLDLSLGKPVRWVGKTPPKDRTLIYIEHSQVNPTIYIVSASASVIGVIIATVFLAFNIKYRNQRCHIRQNFSLQNIQFFIFLIGTSKCPARI